MKRNRAIPRSSDGEYDDLFEDLYAGAEDDKILRRLEAQGYTEAEARERLAKATQLFNGMSKQDERAYRARRGPMLMLIGALGLPIVIGIELLWVYVLHWYADIGWFAVGILGSIGTFFVGLATWLWNRDWSRRPRR